MLSHRRDSKLWLPGALVISACLLGVDTASDAQDSEKFTDQQLEFFEAQVRPLLVKKCFDCHGPEASPVGGGLSMASRKSLLVGGDTGPAIEPGLPDKSLLIDAINYGDVYQMPPDTKMSPAEIEVFTKWIKMSAPWPAEAEVVVETAKPFDIQARTSDHWCWQPIKSVSPPAVADQDWPLNPIDNFVLAKMVAAGVQPAETASKRTLIRRLYFDLIGLPPTPSQIQAFLDDPSEDAYSKVVDELLASERFGERWARHWMDLTRYAETCGHEFDYPIPYAYQYRDYLIRAFNDDVPYDQFIREHIAGDLLATPRRHPTEDYNESILGTGFWFLHEGHHGPVDVKADEAKRIDNQIDVMTKTFLGLTVACARCHDHKFDAISTRDYYSLYGFLKSSHRQVAMLDPGRKIEAAAAESESIAKQSRDILKRFSEVAAAADQTRLAAYLNAALIQLRNDPGWSRPNGMVVQGEAFRVLHRDRGTVQTQKLDPQDGFSWQGNEQIWWMDGQLGDVASFEFDLDLSADEQLFDIRLCLTKAPDYGRAKIALNDVVLDEDFDCFSQQLTTTGPISFGKLPLKPGKQKLTLEITGHNEQSIPRHMLGIDYIEVEPAGTTETQAADHGGGSMAAGLDPELVKRLAEAIKSPRLNQYFHPLYLMQAVANGNTSLDGDFVSEQRRSINEQFDRHSELDEQTVLFEDFDHGLPTDWFNTGFAFANQDAERISVENGFLADPTAIHSGASGLKYKGVIRSPSFTIDHDKIFYRVKGGRAQIRLIIEGYQLDVYNALLFAGMNLEIPASDEYRWIEQAGDLKNHQGHRAHIEIIDQTDGYVSVDAIRFSDGPAPTDAPASLSRKFVDRFDGDVSPTTASLAEFFANQIIDDIDQPGPENVAIRNWILENDLADLFENGNSDVAFRNHETGSADFPDSRYSALDLAKELNEIRTQASEIANHVPDPILAIGICDGTPADESIFVRGNHKALGQTAPRNFLEAMATEPLKIEAGSGRSLLADRIADVNNPLTARVAVNRVWHHLLGRGIVRSVDNFGVLGQKPTHPELLDYLAIRFVNDGWSIKQLIRDIVQSRTYQLSSVPLPESAAADPENNLFHSANIQRLEGEAIRDSMLLISGDLNDTAFGPSVPIYLTPFMSGRGRPGESGPLDGNGRRSIYVEVRRNFLSPMMLAFDTPIPFNAVGRRNVSNVPAQALILMNDPFVYSQARQWATKLIAQGQSNEDRIRSMYVEAFGQPPTDAQLQQSLTFLKRQSESLNIGVDEQNGSVDLWQDLGHVLFNVKQFIFVE